LKLKNDKLIRENDELEEEKGHIKTYTKLRKENTFEESTHATISEINTSKEKVKVLFDHLAKFVKGKKKLHTMLGSQSCASGKAGLC
jgi:hypothetical protein